MSDAGREKAQGEQRVAEPLAGLSGVAEEIKQLLSTLAGEIEDSKRTQRQALSQIEARLTRIESKPGEASAKARQEQQFAPRSGGSTEPWDLDAAEALTKSYEAEDPEFVAEPPRREHRKPRPAAAQSHRAPPGQARHDSSAETDLERAWLGHRITDFTQRIKRSLADMRPQSSLVALEERIDQFQKRIAVALDDVARRSDVEGLRRIEAHVGDLGGKLGVVQSQLTRIDGIEGQLQTVMHRLSDERFGKIAGRASSDLEAVARIAAEETHARFAQPEGPSEAEVARFAELRAAIESSISERRVGERQALTMLETMQQALIEVLDRIEAIENTSRVAAAASAPFGPTKGLYDPASELAPEHITPPLPRAVQDFSISAQSLRESDVENGYWSELHAPPLGAGERPEPVLPQPPALASTTAPETDDAEMSVVDKMRRDFVADAQRAKLKATASRTEQRALKTAPRRPQLGSRLSAWVSARTGGGAGQPLGGTPTLIVAVLIAAAAVSGGLMVGLWRYPETRVAHAVKPMSRLPAAQSAAPEVAEDRSQSPETVIQGLNFETGETDVEIGPGADASSLPRSTWIEEAPAPSGKSSSLPQAEESAGTGLSAGLGAVAARANLQALPDERSTASAAGKASALNLPPATVGPLSLRLAAANGDPSAEFEVAVRLAEGKGTAQQLEEAVHWYQRAAARGFAQAQYRLGTHLERGLGVPKDIARARIWYQRAAEKGNVKAMHNLAVLSANSEQATPDYATAAKWFTAAAERGLADSQYNLAILHENGLGVSQSRVVAYKWYSLAAKSGDKDAMARRDAMKAELSAPDLASAEEMTRKFMPKALDAVVNDAHAAGQDWKKREATEANG